MHEFATIFVPFLCLGSGSGQEQGEDISCFEVLDVLLGLEDFPSA